MNETGQDYLRRRDARDRAFKNHAVHVARSLSSYFRNWIQQELLALRPGAQALVESEDLPEPIRLERTESLKIIEEINNYELDEIVRGLEETCDEIEAFDDRDVMTYYYALQDSVSRLERLARRVMRIRGMVDTYWEGDDAVPDDARTDD